MACLFRIASAASFAWALLGAAPAYAEANLLPVSIPAGPLPEALQSLERQTGLELLFDHAVTTGLKSGPIRGELTTEAALRQILADTDLTVRRADSGAWIVERPATPPLAQPDAPVPEILVAGQRTQNADIRRFENDVQPYTVVSAAELRGAHRDTVDQYFTSRVTSDTQVVPTSLDQKADIMSGIDLRGLGSEHTLVLIDGRRMPGVAETNAQFRQTDVNSIPLHAIKRIEVLTGAAGGIYGFGALGGVINVVLDRESQGVDFYATEGLSSRGDGHRQSVEARFGHTSADGATDFMAFAGHSQNDTIRVGDRGYALRDRQRTFDGAPQYYPYSFGNSVAIRSGLDFDPVTGAFDPNPDLVLKPEFGGTSLSSNRTFLPIGFTGNAQAMVASLQEHAGKTDISVPDLDAKDDLGVNPRSSALIANLRHRLGGGVEAYVDALVLRSRGKTRGDTILQTNKSSDGHALLAPESPANPFTGYVDAYFPIESVEQMVWNRVTTSRYTGGLAADLAFDWRGSAEVSVGRVHRDYSFYGGTPGIASLLLLLGDPSDLETNPLGDWDAFQRAISGYGTRLLSSSTLRTRFRNQSLRLAGPVFSNAARPATLTLLAERRTQGAPGYTQYNTTTDLTDGTVTPQPEYLNSSSSATTSFYAELRSRLFDDTAPTPFLRGLELQLAIRHDEEEDKLSKDWKNPESERIHAQFSGTTFTAGAKITPTPWLMFRGSYATGEQPPPANLLVEYDPLEFDFPYFNDARRGGTNVGADGLPYLIRYGGRTDLKTIRASTAFLGAVLTPSGPDGPRLSVDFSRIRRTRDAFSISVEDVLAHEDLWPERVTRAALTEADRASGYTGGAVTVIDTRYSNGASLDVEALDMHASWPLMLLGGRLMFYADATWHMGKLQKAPLQPDTRWTGFRNGPLRWRANGGFDWSTERLTLGANLQYFDSYSVIREGPYAANDFNVEMQGSRSIPPQSYLDLNATWNVPVRDFVHGLTLDLGIVNVLDKAPPRESSFVFGSPGYSRYGDPRQRRFELGLSVHF